MRIGSLNLQQDALAEAFYVHYSGNQYGSGILPAFQGSAYQDGAGLGDILRSFFRHVIPILAPGAASFLSSAVQGLNDGKTFKQAALGGLAPAAKTMVASAGQKLSQIGSGRKRRNTTGASKAGQKRTKGRGPKPVYKPASARGNTSKNHSRSKSFIIPTNF